MLNSAFAGTGKRHPDQPKIQQLAVGRGRGRQGRDVGARAIGPVDRSKHRISALGVLEALLQIRRIDGPAVSSDVAAIAGALVGPKRGEKRIGLVHLGLAESLKAAARVCRGFLEGSWGRRPGRRRG